MARNHHIQMENPWEHYPDVMRIINISFQRCLKLYLGELFWTRPDQCCTNMYKLRGGNHWDAQDRTWPVLALARSSLHHQVRQAAPADWHVGVIELVEHVRYQPTYNLASSPCQGSEQWKKHAWSETCPLVLKRHGIFSCWAQECGIW